MPLSETTFQIFVTLAIIASGLLITKICSSIILAVSKRKDVINVKHIRFVKIFRYVMRIITILAALLFLQVDVINDISPLTSFVSNRYNLLPTILLVILLIVLAITVANLVVFGLKRA